MTDMPRDYEGFAGLEKAKLNRAIRSIQRDLGPMTYSPKRFRSPSPMDFETAVDYLRHYVKSHLLADWIASQDDSEPWRTFAAFVAQTCLGGLTEPGDEDAFVLDLTKCNLKDESGPCVGGYICIGDKEMLVSLLLHVAPHCGDGRALALYQVEII